MKHEINNSVLANIAKTTDKVYDAFAPDVNDVEKQVRALCNLLPKGAVKFTKEQRTTLREWWISHNPQWKASADKAVSNRFTVIAGRAGLIESMKQFAKFVGRPAYWNDAVALAGFIKNGKSNAPYLRQQKDRATGKNVGQPSGKPTTARAQSAYVKRYIREALKKYKMLPAPLASALRKALAK